MAGKAGFRGCSRYLSEQQRSATIGGPENGWGRRILQARTDSSLGAVIDPLFRAAAWGASASGGRLVALFYHRVLAAPDPMLPTEPDARIFDAQMQALGGMFNVLPMDEAVARLAEGRLPPRAACITFDDGYRDNLQIAAPILPPHGMTATFFVASGFLDGGRMFNDTVRESVRRLASGEHDLSWLELGRRPGIPPAARLGPRLRVLHVVVRRPGRR